MTFQEKFQRGGRSFSIQKFVLQILNLLTWNLKGEKIKSWNLIFREWWGESKAVLNFSANSSVEECKSSACFIRLSSFFYQTHLSMPEDVAHGEWIYCSNSAVKQPITGIINQFLLPQRVFRLYCGSAKLFTNSLIDCRRVQKSCKGINIIWNTQFREQLTLL